PSNSRRRGIAFEAAVIPAVTERSIRVDGHVADLPSHAVRPAPQLAAEYDTAAYPRAESYHDYRRGVLTRACPPFAERRAIGVVFHDDVGPRAKLPDEVVAYRIIRYVRYIRGLSDDARFGVYVPGNAYPDPRDAPFSQLVNELCDVLYD